MYDITSRLEINLKGNEDLNQLMRCASRLRVPALVVPPNILAPIMQSVNISRYNFRIITTIDFGKRTKTYGSVKITREIDPHGQLMSAGGYDIALTPNKNSLEISNEVYHISNLIRNNINKTSEIRFCLEITNSDDDFISLANAVKKYPIDYIRIGSRTDAESQPEILNEKIHTIKSIVACKIKVSGNFNVDDINKINADRFDVDLQNAIGIEKELNQFMSNKQLEENKDEESNEERNIKQLDLFSLPSDIDVSPDNDRRVSDR